MDRLPDCWVHRCGLADLGLAGDRGTPASLNRAHLAHATHDCGGFGDSRLKNCRKKSRGLSARVVESKSAHTARVHGAFPCNVRVSVAIDLACDNSGDYSG